MRPNVDLRVSAKHKHDFVAVSRSLELMASIDEVVEKMEQQLRKYKEKVQDRHRGRALARRRRRRSLIRATRDVPGRPARARTVGFATR